MQGLKHYALLVSLQARTLMQYRDDLLLQAAAVAVQNTVWFYFIWLMFERLPRLGGWAFWHVVLLFGTVSLQRCLVEFLFEGLWELPSLALRGELDRLIVRPISPLVHVFTITIGFHGVGNLVVGLALVGLAFAHVEPVLGAWTLLYYPVAVASGALLLSGLNLALCSLCFWFVGTDNSLAFMVFRIADFMRFPIDLYPSTVRSMFTWVLPMIFLGYAPVGFLLGHTSALLGLASPLVALAVFMAARAWFYAGLARYQGSGS